MAVSAYDQNFLSDEDQKKIQSFTDAYNTAKAAGDTTGMESAHAAAEAVRAGSNYTGGTDGSEYNYIQSSSNYPTYTAAELPSYTAQTDAVSNAYDAATQYQISQLKNAYDTNLSTLQAEQAKIPETYQSQRNQVGAQYETQKSNFNELANANGLNTGAYGQAALAQSNTYQTNLTTLNKAEADAQADVEKRISDLQTTYQNDISSALAQGEYEKAAALLEEYRTAEQSAVSTAQAQANENYNAYQSQAAANDTAYNRALDEYNKEYQASRDQVSDNQWQQSFDYNAGRDAISDARYADETQYNRDIYADETAYNRGIYADETQYNRALEFAETLADNSGDFSGYAALGYSDDQIAMMQDLWAYSNFGVNYATYKNSANNGTLMSLLASSSSGGSSGGSSGKSSSGSSSSSSSSGSGTFDEIDGILAKWKSQGATSQDTSESIYDAYTSGLISKDQAQTLADRYIDGGTTSARAKGTDDEETSVDTSVPSSVQNKTARIWLEDMLTR